MTNRIDLANATPREIERALLNYAAEKDWESWNFWRDESSTEEVTDLGTVTRVQTEGGASGDGEYTHVVVQVTQDSLVRYFKKPGYYSSYGGTDWDGTFHEVKPYTRTVTVYE